MDSFADGFTLTDTSLVAIPEQYERYAEATQYEYQNEHSDERQRQVVGNEHRGEGATGGQCAVDPQLLQNTMNGPYFFDPSHNNAMTSQQSNYPDSQPLPPSQNINYVQYVPQDYIPQYESSNTSFVQYDPNISPRLAPPIELDTQPNTYPQFSHPRPAPSRHKLYKPEQPRKDSDKDWVRVNQSTQGLSSRTGKINNYDAQKDGQYNETLHPFATLGEWRTGEHRFSYNRTGELSRLTLTVAEMNAFIYEHPGNLTECQRPVLWIQRVPADSARRYPTRGSSKCRFQDCPGRIFSRSIAVGLYRVALDDQWTTYGEERDPFVVAGYVHLYCLERFCDLPDICRRFDVRADNRDLASEPRGRFAPSLCREPEADVVERFIAACRNARPEGFREMYPDYPDHNICVANGWRKEHRHTLTYEMTVTKLEFTSASKRRLFEKRGEKASHITVHLGDLEMQVKARRNNGTKKVRGVQKKKVQVDEDEDEDMEMESALASPQAAPQTRKRASRASVSAKGAQRRRHAAGSDSEGDAGDATYTPPVTRRSSGRRRVSESLFADYLEV